MPENKGQTASSGAPASIFNIATLIYGAVIWGVMKSTASQVDTADCASLAIQNLILGMWIVDLIVVIISCLHCCLTLAETCVTGEARLSGVIGGIVGLCAQIVSLALLIAVSARLYGSKCVTVDVELYKNVHPFVIFSWVWRGIVLCCTSVLLCCVTFVCIAKFCRL